LTLQRNNIQICFFYFIIKFRFKVVFVLKINSFLIGLFIYSLVITLLLVIFIVMREKNRFLHSKILYETGVEVNKFVRPPFSIQFFLIGLIFVLFDLEIIFLIGLFFSVIEFTFFLAFFFYYITNLYFVYL